MSDKKYPPVLQLTGYPIVGTPRNIAPLQTWLNNLGKMTFVLSGEFAHSANRLNIQSALRGAGFRSTASVTADTGIIVYSSVAVSNSKKLVVAQELRVPVIMNEAAACDLLRLHFKQPSVPSPSERQGSWEEARRATGRSSRMAMAYLHQAWSNLGKPVVVSDHYGTREADLHCLLRIKSMVDQLRLKGFEFNQVDMTVVFNGYTPDWRKN